MEKRYQIFVSSTFADLKAERQAVMQALLSLDHFPAGMELFPASDDDQWTFIKGVIDDSDYYVIVIGGRYGSVNEQGISFTEMEFDYAVASGKPILAFVHENPEEILAKNTDQNDALRSRLKEFQKKVCTGRVVKFWNNPAELQSQVILSVSAETKRNPQEGWIRTSQSSDPTVMESLRQEIDRLTAALNAASTAAPPDAAQYASGNDQFKIEMEYSYAGETKYRDVSLSWNVIFAELAPTLMDESSERQMKRYLSDEFPRYDKDFPVYSRASVLDDSFETIKVQLFALGLIKKSEKRHVPSDTNKYWTLTSYGSNMLMKFRAIRKAEL